MIFIHLLIISFISAFIVDYSGAVKDGRAWLNKNVLHRPEDARLKPFDCSTCVAFWAGLAYIICRGAFNVPNLGGVCVAAMLAQVFNNLQFRITELFNNFLNHE